MNRSINIMKNIILIAGGMILAAWSVFKWSEIGFRYDLKIYPENLEGNSFLVVAFIGIAMVFYGIIDFLIMRHRCSKAKKELGGIDKIYI